jgi:branched-chain amino acid aminotransferase
MSDCLHTYFIRNSTDVPVSLWDKSIHNTGKSVYEVIRVIEGVPLFLDDHLERFTNSLHLSGLKSGMSVMEIKRALKRLIKINEVSLGNIMFMFHYNGIDAEPLFMAWFIPHFYPSGNDYKYGVRLILFHAERENRQAKVLNQELREIIRQKVVESGAYEALLVDREGFLTEGSKSNFFALKNGILYTAPEEEVLLGITRKYIFEICKKAGIGIREEKVHESELSNYDACFVSGTSPKILPASAIEHHEFKTENQVLKTIMHEYDKLIREYISSGKEVE